MAIQALPDSTAQLPTRLRQPLTVIPRHMPIPRLVDFASGQLSVVFSTRLLEAVLSAIVGNHPDNREQPQPPHMLVIHWSPVKNTKTILKHGIRKSKRGVFCFPLTGHRSVDRWWAQAFRSYWRPRTQYNGFVFRVTQADLPAKFCDWVVEPFAPSPIYTELPALEAAFKTTLLWRLENNWRRTGISDPETIERFIRQDPSIISRLRSDAGLMDFVFKDHQILLSHSIPPHRILRVIPGSNMSGRERVRNSMS